MLHKINTAFHVIIAVLADCLLISGAFRIYQYLLHTRPIGRMLLQFSPAGLDYRLVNIDLYAAYVVFIVFLFVGLLPWLSCYYTANTADYNAPAGRFLFHDFMTNKRPGSIIAICWRVHADQRAKARFIDNRKATSNAKATGIILGKKDKKTVYCSPETEEGHVLCVGGSGTGKTAATAIPTLRRWHGTAFVIDISGDISKNVKKCKNELVFAPLSDETCFYDVFYQIDRTDDFDTKYELIQELAFVLLPDEPNDKNGNYFTRGGREILTAAMLHFYYKGMDFIDIVKTIAKTPTFELLQELYNSQIEAVSMLVNHMNGENERNVSGCKGALDTALQLFTSRQNLARCMRRSTLRDEPFVTPDMLETHSIYFEIPKEKMTLYSPLIGLVVTQVMRFMQSRDNDNTHPILLMIDEFSSFQINEIIDAIENLRKKHVRIMLLCQSLEDIDARYSIEYRKRIINSTAFNCIYSCNDPDSQLYIARKAGKIEQDTESVNFSDSGLSRTLRRERVDAIEPASLAFLPKEDKLLIFNNNGYCFATRNMYWKYDKKYNSECRKETQL